MSRLAARACLIALLGCTASCGGPTLEVGERIAPLTDAAVSNDAAAAEADASDASRRRDADTDHRFCREEHECSSNAAHQHCNLLTGHCVDCIDDRNCPSSDGCVLPEGQCVTNHGRDPNEPPSGGP